jgi:hypothetical protein
LKNTKMPWSSDPWHLAEPKWLGGCWRIGGSVSELLERL